ncbi:MAG: hypothetical protein K9J16_00800 [Melioribacteraceae bacterium]|nr:hypothetical protein [Melioribacteraceae bacterium]MCF8356368.1 hypothetical protein [Melioribacteraceae bacterium]MCF8392264.1 hypothetical protein [Melioribacteraceae bacterium]MCF8417596.1 hypothetical protein [Melioribacteraceae bacterium]
MKKIFFIFFAAAIIISAQTKPTSDMFGSIRARHIGPATMSGRISAIDASNIDPRVIWVGSAGGGIWKSTNSGTTFKPVFDDHTQSIGTITIDQRRPDTVWVGTGETWVRNSVSVGDGIYRTTNGGSDWEHLGLENTERISKVIIHPENPNIIYVAALGQLWSANPERGVFKSTDWGKSWSKILFIDDNTGCSDLVIEPGNPNVIYAGMWDFRRKAYTFRSGGPGSSLFKSTNGGDSWNEIIEGLPEGDKGRIALAVTELQPEMVYALVESEKTGLYTSTDYGNSWELKSTSVMISERPFYFSLIVADQVDSNKIYKPGMASLWVSNDAGASFTSTFIEGGKVHSDHHAFWINPNNNSHLYLGTDGGLYTSYDKGSSWIHSQNLPLSQFYHVSVDNKKPYNVYGGLQDNGSWFGPSQSPGGIENSDWQNVGFGDGFNVVPDPGDENIIFWQYQGGNTYRFYIDTREAKDIKPYSDDADEKLRFNWNTPLVISRFDQNVIYTGAQYLFRSSDKGDNWEKISPDLTTNDVDKQQQENSGGITIDNSTAENHCTIITISDSPIESKYIWVGTDDGNLQVTSDGGETWTNTVQNISGLPASTWSSFVYASNFDTRTAYAAFDGHRSGDMNSYLFKTTDLGETWIDITDENIQGYCHVVKEDPVNPNLLFLGTEFGLYISLDSGDNWFRFDGNIPKVGIFDLVIHPTTNDVVLATHGRGILIIDNISPVRQLSSEIFENDVTLLENEPYIINDPQSQQTFSGDQNFVGGNPPNTAMITYYMKKRHIFGDMYLEIIDKDGNVIKKLTAGKKTGINRVPWYINKKPPKVKVSSPLLISQVAYGPSYPPGEYTVRLVKGKNIYESKIILMDDPDSRHSKEDREMQFAVLNKSYNMIEEISFLVKQVVDLSKAAIAKSTQVEDEELKSILNEASKDMDALQKELVSTSSNRLSGEIRLTEKIADVYGSLVFYQGRPTESQINRLNVLEKEYKKQLAYYESTLSSLNEKLQEAGIQVITVTTREEYFKED